MGITYPYRVECPVTCSACGHVFQAGVIFSEEEPAGRYASSCPNCGGLLAERVSEELSNSLVHPVWSKLPEDPEQSKYFDITYYDADGKLCRRHGWYDTRNDKIVQVG